MKKRGLLLAASILTVLLCAAPNAHAIGNGGVGGTPANPDPNNPRTQSIFVYQLKPGAQKADGVKIVNNTDEHQTVSVLAVDSVLSGGGAFACRQAGEPKVDVGSWIKLDTNTLELEPSDSQVVPFTLTVPDTKNIDVGEHNGCITIQAASQTAEPSKKNGITLSFRSAIRVAVTIPGKIIKSLTLEKVEAKPTDKGKYLIIPTAKNDGNVSLDANIQIKMMSLFGTEVMSVKEGSSPVLPRTKASWNYEVSKPFWGGFYRARAIATYNSNTSSELGVDKNATLVTKQQDSNVFFVAPTLAAGLIELAFLLVLIGLVVWYLRKRKHAAHVDEHWKSYTVKKNDTLQSLAETRGVTWKHIARVNKLKAPYHLDSGQKLKLPPVKE